ncbi:PH domain-containing protein [Knoellia koreensis]|uniref:PH domain-containing protein n=1 Tax=Knoellia koreensis TaxID=2730921 RepID=A0A849HIW2_9MICO|nr:PH domain-containing protein [Knoellia sp. DB2414S]
MTDTPESTAPPEPHDGGQPWQRLHPLSPLLRGGIAFVAVLAYVLSQQLDTIFGAEREDPTFGHLWWAVLAVVVVLLLIVAGAWVSWRFSRFRLTPTLIELRTGFVFRQHRQVRFDRIQAVDIGRPLLARLFGLSEVVVQSAGGKDSNLKLSYLTDAAAQRMREELIELARHSDEEAPHRRAAGDAAYAGSSQTTTLTQPADDHATQVLAVPNSRIVQSILYSGPALTFLLAAPALVVSLVLGAPGMVAWLGPMTLAIGGGLLKRLTKEANFQLLHEGDRLRIRHGLTDIRTTTVPLHRIQAIEVSQSLPWRFPGWWRIQVNVAGVGGSDDDDTENVLLPVGRMDEALRVLTLVRLDLPEEAAVAAMTGEGPHGGFVTASERAKPFDPLSWRRRGYAALPDEVVTRRGVLWRSVQVVPHARIQSLTISQGPWERRRGVASVKLVSTPGPVGPAVEHLDVEEALRLLDEQVVRSSEARRLAARPA